MKYLKLFEQYVDEKRHWYCTTEAIKIISKILDVMEIDYEMRYDADDDLDGTLDYHELVNFDFRIDGYEYSIVIDANENEEDNSLYDGCNITTHLFTLDQEDPNYESDPYYLENGKELLDILIEIKGNPWMKRINESSNEKEKIVDKIREIFNFLVEGVENKYGEFEDDNFVNVDFYKNLGIDTNFTVDTEDGNYFKFDGFCDEHATNEFSVFNNIPYERYSYEFEELTLESLKKILHLLVSIPIVSGYLNKDMFKKVNESKIQKWECMSDSIEYIKRLLKTFKIDYIYYPPVVKGSDIDIDGLTKDRIKATFEFTDKGKKHYVHIYNKKVKYNFYGCYVMVTLDEETQEGTYVDNPMKTKNDLLNKISTMGDQMLKWMKKINENSQNINREKLINKIKHILDFLLEKTKRDHNFDNSHDVMDLIDREESFVYTDFYETRGIDSDLEIDLINYSKEKLDHFDGFDFNYLIGRLRDGKNIDWVLYGNYDSVDFKYASTDSLLKIINMLVQVPEVSTYLNADMFKKLNNDN